VNALKGQLLDLAIVITLIGYLTGCASTTRERLEERQNRNNARAAAYAADGFTLDHRSPEPRPYNPWEFYYKNCTLVSRNPYPSQAEYACADPH